MKIKILCVGKIKERFYSEAVAEYVKRLGRFCNVEIAEVDDCPDGDVEKIKKKEAKALLPGLEGFCICLDIDGKQFSSEEFAQKLKETKDNSSVITFVIGGSHGLYENVKDLCKMRLSFGKMTFPHQLMRVILCEQIYRAFMILSGSTYHK